MPTAGGLAGHMGFGSSWGPTDSLSYELRTWELGPRAPSSRHWDKSPELPVNQLRKQLPGAAR